MFSTMATVGWKCRKLPWNSQASTMKSPLSPRRVEPPMKSSSPPMWMVGFTPACRKACASMEVVVVLPWVPDTPMAKGAPSISWPMRSQRSIWGMPSRAASARSGFSGAMAAL